MLRERWKTLGSQKAGRLLVHQVNFEGGHGGAEDVDEEKQEAQEMAFILNSLGIQK
jgi:protease II